MYAPPKQRFIVSINMLFKREEEKVGTEGKKKILIVVLVTRVFGSVSTPHTYLNTLTQTL